MVTGIIKAALKAMFVFTLRQKKLNLDGFQVLIDSDVVILTKTVTLTQPVIGLLTLMVLLTLFLMK